MRNPLPVLAAALLTAAGAIAGDLPTWKPVEEPYSAWRYVDFTDAAGTRHTLYCRWSECGAKVKTGTAPLYVLERAGEQPYTASEPYHPQYAGTYAGKTWEWLKGKTTNVEFQSTKTTFKSEVSRFVLDLSADPNKAVIKGTDVAIPVEPEHAAVSPTGWLFIVLSPVSVADDAPKPAPAKPGPVPIPKPKPKPHPAPTPTPLPKPKPAPGAHVAAPELTVLERYWLIPTERSRYVDQVNAAKGAKAALQAAYKDARATVTKNLRDADQAPYKQLVDGGKFDQIDALLTGKNYSGWDVMLRPEEHEALKSVLKTADSHADFVAPNAAAQYDLDVKSILGPDGKPQLNEHLYAHQLVVKYRAMVPAKPGTTPVVKDTDKIPDSEFNAIPDAAVRDALHKKYDEDWPKQDTDEKKKALNADYRKKIKDAIAAATTTAPKTPFDPASIKTLKDLMHLPLEDRKKFCGMSSGEGVAASCSDILDATSDAMTQCMSKKGVGAKSDSTAVAKAKRECLETIHPECKGAPNAPIRKTSMADLPADMQTYCAKLLGGSEPPISSPRTTTGSSIDSSPCPGAKAQPKDGAAAASPSDHAGKDVDPCPKKDDAGPDPNFYTNLGNGLAFGVGGLLLASFFGGPLLMLAVGLAAGVGGYYYSKSITEPKKKDKS